MTDIGTFPFGQPVKKLVQQDRTPKQVFVLGVYASAVHATWIGADGKKLANALAVASEPYIFWRGERADEIISQITIPSELGKLVPADPQFNGPSGLKLDELFLTPLGFRRADGWLCDLVPHSCCNAGQKQAIDRAYLPLAERHGLSIPSVPDVPAVLADEARQKAILDELRESQAKLLVLLGDLPIQWFLRYFDNRWNRLSDFMPYGHRHRMKLDGLEVDVLPLCHPRQAARLGSHSTNWFEEHGEWMKSLPSYR